MKLTFKQYLESKEQLLKAVENVPIAENEYTVIHYCTLPLGEYEEDKIAVSLKPRQKIIVEWRYDSMVDPTPQTIRLEGVEGVDNNEHHQTFWSSKKLQKWLQRHTKGA